MVRSRPSFVSVARRSAALIAALAVLPLVGAGTGHADPIVDNKNLLIKTESSNGSYIVRGVINDARHLTVLVHSMSMGTDIPVMVQRPADTSVPRPSLYLLNGAGGGVDAATWTLKTNVLQFLSDKNVNVISPVGGPYSYYTDWKNPDPVLGKNMWKTFLTEELPPLIDAGLGTNHTNAIAGLSSSGTSVLALAEAAPHMYKSVAAYSGCAQTSDPIGQQFVSLVISKGGGDPNNIFGPPKDPRWVENDPYVNAEKLRGMSLYISSGNGLPGAHDVMDDPHGLPGVGGLANQIIVGGAIEAATDYCTHNMQAKLGQLGIPAHFNFQPNGTHSWGYWEDAFKDSWPVLAGGLGI